ncbi:MAG TPA: hypothetical protein VE993_19850 [Stellaceae bacterium]|nr:hypothetical protein [Stellaceae bacterium]
MTSLIFICSLRLFAAGASGKAKGMPGETPLRSSLFPGSTKNRLTGGQKKLELLNQKVRNDQERSLFGSERIERLFSQPGVHRCFSIARN